MGKTSNIMVKVMSKKNYKFGNASNAMQHCNSLMMWYATRKLLCSSRMNLANNTIELTVHIDDLTEPLNKGLYTYRELNSFTTWSDVGKEAIRIRTATFYFNY